MLGLRLRSLFFNVGWYVGSTIIAVIGFALALPTSIEYYNRFTPATSLVRYLIRDSVPLYLLITLSLTVITMIAVLVARVLRLLLKPSSELE